MFVRVIDNLGNDVQEPMALNRDGYPFDIDSTPWGFVALIKDKADPNKLYLLGMLADGTEKFCRTIMDNGPQPTEPRDQLRFYSDSKGKLEFGLQAMFKPSNGKVAYNKGRIGVVFAHYNHFGLKEDGSRDDHTGDTIVHFDENGQNEILVSTWFTSHSLQQQMISTFSGVFFIFKAMKAIYKYS